MRYANVESPIGDLLLVSDGHTLCGRHTLCGLYMREGRKPVAPRAEWTPSMEPFGDVRAQLSEYFAGQRSSFDLPLRLDGTPFQRRVWRALRDIAYGQTMSYGELARRIGQPSAARAVGLANGRNPIAVIVPCHRVVGANGTLTGYGGGVERKRFLLDLEAGQRSLVAGA
jgi:methylated-DNA-[protein]-cysteine S-methyltransferase